VLHTTSDDWRENSGKSVEEELVTSLEDLDLEAVDAAIDIVDLEERSSGVNPDTDVKVETLATEVNISPTLVLDLGSGSALEPEVDIAHMEVHVADADEEVLTSLVERQVTEVEVHIVVVLEANVLRHDIVAVEDQVVKAPLHALVVTLDAGDGNNIKLLYDERHQHVADLAQGISVEALSAIGGSGDELRSKGTKVSSQALVGGIVTDGLHESLNLSEEVAHEGGLLVLAAK
jgi:hypothetical protein